MAFRLVTTVLITSNKLLYNEMNKYWEQLTMAKNLQSDICHLIIQTNIFRCVC